MKSLKRTYSLSGGKKLISKRMQMHDRLVYTILAATGVAILCLTLLAQTQSIQQAERDAQLTSFSPALPITEHRRGSDTAPLQLYVYFDTDCPYCIRFHERALPELLRRYKKDIAVSYLYMPLRPHPKAFGEALLAECASKIGGEEYFWPAIDLLLRTELHAPLPTSEDIDQFASALTIPATPLTLCLNDATAQNRIRRDMHDAIFREVGGVPTIIVSANGKQKMIATANILKLQPVIDELYRIK